METIHKELQDLLRSFLKNNPDGVREIAHEFDVSFPTVQRWAMGKGFPHRVMCPPLIAYLKNRFRKGAFDE